ncbi:MAG: bifunctional phosphoribosylaminoimidazolecarboxamide formyltransferase/IMP cyclohydrolase [Candidatus Cloacimonetes bacterium]|nr:bifunctional phosphoribosylaminoimidazolecarboxamide formyltransferase/IMP cyclohydrolase [Candidatus Cloacimonadota bacterium]
MEKRALVSVSNKTGVADFARRLHQSGYKIISTGGTAYHLEQAGIPVISVDSITGFPEMMDGRVKTLHPKVHGGILANRNIPEHVAVAKQHGIDMIDMVVVNLYPFEQTIKKTGVTQAEAIENIDIGGPSMIRSAAKNCAFVVVVVDPEDYDFVATEVEAGGLSPETLLKLSGKAFTHTAHYDSVISNYFNKENKVEFPDYIQASAPLKETLRYGENPHQKAALYEDSDSSPITQLHGKQLSYNNYLDIDAALRIIHRFMNWHKPVVTIIKHLNPCGIGSGNTLTEAYEKAFATDTLSPFGGIVIVNRPLDIDTAETINKIFTEIIIAPDFTPEALAKLKKKKNRRLIQFDTTKLQLLKGKQTIASCMTGYLCQDADIDTDTPEEWRVVSVRKPSEKEMEALRFGWLVVASLKSNAVCFTGPDRTIGLGIGQTSRIDSTEIAIAKASKFELSIEGSICASDGFFPFRDSIDVIAELGIKAVIQPGGSKGDEEVIQACNEHGIAMIMTGMRHFRH